MAEDATSSKASVWQLEIRIPILIVGSKVAVCSVGSLPYGNSVPDFDFTSDVSTVKGAINHPMSKYH